MMKKNNLFCIVLFLAALFGYGCEKYLEELPQNKLKPATTDDFEQLLNHGYITQQILPYLDVLSDDVDLIASHKGSTAARVRGDEQEGAYMWWESHEVTLPNGDQAFRAFYESIFYANVVIENIEDAIGMELNAANVERIRKNIKGEALAVRAYAHFYLVNLYAKAYDPATAATDPGIPINTSSGVSDEPRPRNTVQEVYDQMVSDLVEGISLMEANPIAKAAKVKFTALSAKALLARVYCYMHEWDRAIESASAVFRENSNLFNLHEAGERLTLEGNNNIVWNAASLWGADYLGKNNPNVLFVHGVQELIPLFAISPGLTTFSVNRELGEQYEPNDVRRLYFMGNYPTTTAVSGDIEKFTHTKNRLIPLGNILGVAAVAPANGYSRVIRTEEMLLILAEAHARKSSPDLSAAIDNLNRLRQVKFKQGAYIPLSASNFTQQSLITFIFQERRLEFCHEGHRWFDLRRSTRPAMERVGYDNQVARLAQDDPRYVLQIPMRELDINPAIGPNPR